MELGNMVFGNSRGEYHISRSSGFEDILFRLFDLLEPGNSGYGADFENDVFSCMRYWWGDCTCGTDAPYHDDGCPACWKNKRWLSDRAECTCGGDSAYETQWRLMNEFTGGEHLDNCYQIEYEKIPSWIETKNKSAYYKQIKELYKKFGIPIKNDKTWWHGCASICTCGYYEKIGLWDKDHGHTDDCMLVRPNFLYKPTGFSISWYKYPLRDSYSNEKFDHEKLTKIIDACIASLGEQDPTKE